MNLKSRQSIATEYRWVMGKPGAPEQQKFVPNGSKVRGLREAAGLTQHQLDGLSPGIVGKIELRSVPTTQKVLERMARALGQRVWTDLLDNSHAANAEVITSATKTFHDLRDDYIRWEHRQPKHIPLVAKSLAIDLTDGWDFIYFVIAATKSVHIKFKIAMLTWQEDTLLPDGHATDGLEYTETVSWSRTAAVKFRDIQQRYEAGEVSHPKKDVTLEIRTYRTVPTIHGMLAEKGDEHLLAYTRCCLQNGPPQKYTWGPRGYRLILSDNGRPGLESLGGDWLRQFDTVWNEDTIVLPSKAVPVKVF